jgi:hypothetical protein
VIISPQESDYEKNEEGGSRRRQVCSKHPEKNNTHCMFVGESSPLPLCVPLLPVVIDVGNYCSSAEARDESANSSDGHVVAVVVGHG